MISTVDIKPNFLQPIGIEGIAKVSMSWFLGCDLVWSVVGLVLVGHPCHRVVDADYFFNNDMEYLKYSDPERTYTTSITKTKATRYEIKGIEDKKIIGVKSVSVKKLHGYGHLEEIVVKRTNRQFYKFKEGDFVDLHLNDIKDMLLLAVQHKLFHLINNDIVDFIMALRMFTRSLVIKKWVKNL
uniref:Uncharacterized protein n=1 Tax=Tanacetum cinerariifolium TaxID=118510 RepID=A0A6L2KSF4_TANCI|nr:hypothetical protein [Tanacetum cinerariifolium]